MPEQKTSIVLEAQAKGLDRIAQFARAFESNVKSLLTFQKASDKNVRSVSDYRAAMTKLQKGLQDVSASQLDLLKSMQGMDKASEPYKKLTEQMEKLKDREKGLRDEARLTSEAYRHLGEAVERANQKRGSFTQGVLQGMVPEAAYLQRGPGMFRQALGANLGARARQFGSGAASSLFTGAQGLVTAASSIPGGGIVAGQLQSAMGMSQQALESQRLAWNLNPVIGTANENAARAAGQRAAARERGPSNEEIGKEVGKARGDVYRRTANIQPSEELIQRELAKGAINPSAAGVVGAPSAAAQALIARSGAGQRGDPRVRAAAVASLKQQWEDAEGNRVEDEVRARMTNPEALRKRREDVRAKAEAEVRAQFENPLQAGTRFGMDRNAMLQLAGTIGQVSGGRILETQAGQRMLPLAAAAQSGYGIGGEVSGAFLQAQRRGGLVNGQAGAEGMLRTIGDAVALGLSGSELTEYMERVAQGIEEWKTTGISLDATSIGEMGLAVARTGIGGVQGARVAQGLQQAGRNMVSSGGPQTGSQLALMQEVYGFKGGGISDWVDTLQRMQEGQMEEGGFGKLMGRFTQAGGGVEGADVAIALKAFQEMGIPMSVRNLKLMFKQAKGGPLSADEQKELAKVQDELAVAAGGRPSEAQLLAQGTAPGALRQAAGTANRQIAAGGKVLPAMLNLEEQSARVANAFSTGLGPELNKLTGHLVNVSKGFERFAEAMRKGGFLEAMEQLFTPGTGG